MESAERLIQAELQKEREHVELELKKERELAKIRLQEKQEEKDIPEAFNVSRVKKLLPVFNEQEPENFFVVFEETAKTLAWPKDKWVLIIRSSFTGQAEHIVTQMISENDYDTLKKAILDAYSITAEGYRQKFRSSFKTPNQTFLEFCNLKIKQLQKWLDKAGISTFEDLKCLFLLEEFLRKIPINVAMYIKERGAKKPKEATLLADEYFLIHKGHLKQKAFVDSKVCSFCKERGHLIQDCPKPRCKGSNQQTPPKTNSSPNTGKNDRSKPTEHKTMHCAIKEDGFDNFKVSWFITVSDLTSESVLPLVTIPLTSPYTDGIVEVAYLDKQFPCKEVDILMGNDLAKGKVHTNLIIQSPETYIKAQCNIVTRSQASQGDPESGVIPTKVIPSKVSKATDMLDIPTENFAKAQQLDDSVKQMFEKVRDISDEDSKTPYFYLENKVLMRHYRPPKMSFQDNWRDKFQVVVPKVYRQSLLDLAHTDNCHLGITKTYQRLADDFYWLGMKKDVQDFVKACATCQQVGKPNQTIPPAPLIPISVPKEPFSKVIIDCVGPLKKTRKGNEYILTLICPTTRFPMAVPVKNISAKVIIKQLINIFTVFGFPAEVQCDQGTNFMSKVFQETLATFNLKQVIATAYHPQTNGALERSHQTVKSLIRNYVFSTGNDWDEELDMLMYVLRSVKNESTDVSPFELMFGRKPRTLLTAVKDRILRHSEKEEVFNASKFIAAFKSKLSKIQEFAQNNLQISQEGMKFLHDKKSKVRTFQVGDEVLLYHPIVGSPLREKYMGPYTIAKKVSKVNYVINTADRRKKTQMVHVNRLKPFIRKTPEVCNLVFEQGKTENSFSVESDDNSDSTVSDEVIMSWEDSNNSSILGSLTSYLNFDNRQHSQQLEDLILENKDFFTDHPGKCTVGQHDVIMKTDVSPIRQSFYRISKSKLDILKAETLVTMDTVVSYSKPSRRTWEMCHPSTTCSRFATIQGVLRVLKSGGPPLKRNYSAL
ncbi:uncharacterized protein [Macrobrachium rosenbergii]|uniref:uncharacterized protein n=1 Tax=Macrobrachium rosenbergii TaxID=79674 RepID=UPI0034D5E55C